MLKSYKFSIYPSKAQNHKLCHTLDLCCELYNAALQERREAFKIAKISLNYHSQAIQLPEIKECRTEFDLVHSQVLQDTLKRLDKAFAAFFRRVKSGDKAGFPRFRSRSRYDSFPFPQSGFAVESGKLKLSKIGKVKIKLHRQMEGKVKTCTISQSPIGKRSLLKRFSLPLSAVTPCLIASQEINLVSLETIFVKQKPEDIEPGQRGSKESLDGAITAACVGKA